MTPEQVYLMVRELWDTMPDDMQLTGTMVLEPLPEAELYGGGSHE